MGYPERLLSEGEVIETEFRPHWSGVIREVLILLVGVAAAAVVATLGWSPWFYLGIVVLVVVFGIGGFVRWVTTTHVITSERIIFRAGFVAKQGTEIPLEVIQNVAFNQTVFERMFGTGDLMIESAGTHGQTRYRDIPDPEAVQSLIYRVREARLESSSRAGRGAADPDTSISQLERLSRLHDAGKLTDAEFEEQKAKLLGGDA